MTQKFYSHIVFTHIPRCGGTSLKQSLYNNIIKNDKLNTKRIYIAGVTHGNISVYHNPELIPAIHHDTTIFMDHSPYNTIEKIFNIDYSSIYRIIAIRNPIDRIISHAKHFYGLTESTTDMKAILDKTIKVAGFCTLEYLTLCTEYDEYDIPDKIKISSDIIKNEYHALFNLTDPSSSTIDDFNANNPFKIKLELVHLNSSNMFDFGSEVRNYIYERIKPECQLLEEFIEIDI